jgi:hypothetical protein
VTPRQFGYQHGAGTGVHGELPVEGRCAHGSQATVQRAVLLARKRVGQPATGVVDQDLDWAEVTLGGVEQGRRYRGVGQVGLQSDGAVAGRLDLPCDVLPPPHAVLSVADRSAVGGAGLQAQVGQQDERASLGQRTPGRRADAVVGAGDQGDAAFEGAGRRRHGRR